MSKCEECKYENNIISCTIDEQGEHHSFNDEPALIWSDGTKHWYKNGLVHRDNDLPAAITSGNAIFWCKNGLEHRENGLPAICWPDGKKEWYYEGNKTIAIQHQILYVKKVIEINKNPAIVLNKYEDDIFLCLQGDKKFYVKQL